MGSDGDEEPGEGAEPRQMSGIYATVAQNIVSAYGDTDARTPILLLLTNSIDTHDLIREFYKTTGLAQNRIIYCALYRGMEQELEDKIERALERGDWIILEHLHTIPHWLPVLEDMVDKWRNAAEINPRFRLWVTCVPMQ